MLMTELKPQGEAMSWQEMGVLVWPHTRQERNRLHGQHAYCPAPKSWDPDIHSLDARCESVGCFDLFHDVLLATVHRMNQHDRPPTTNVPAYVARVVQHELVERQRRHRVSMGFPAKPSRSDGVAGRVIAAITAGSSEPDRTWLVSLFRILRSYPFTPGRTTSVWPLDGLTAEKCQADSHPRTIGSSEARAELRGDVEHVLAIARQVAGPQWVFDNIQLPMLAFHGCVELPEQLAV